MLAAITKKVKQSLKWKLVAMIAAILVFTVSAIGYVGYNQTMRSVGKDIDRLSKQILTQANMNLDRYYTEYEMIFLLLGSSLEYREWLHASGSQSLTSLSVRYYERIKENYLNRVFLQYPEVMSVSMYNPRGLEQHFTNAAILSSDYSIRSEAFLGESGRYDKVKFIPRTADYYMDRSNQKVEKPVLTLFKRFYDGYLRMDISLTPSQNVMDRINIVDSSAAAVIDGSGTIIHHSESGEVMQRMDERVVKLLAGKQQGSIYDSDRQELIVYQSIARTGWQILAIIPYEKIAGSLYHVRNTTIVISVAALIVSVFLTYWAAASVVRRIAKLRQAMFMTQVKNDFSLRAQVEGTDEVTDLSVSFNKLLGHLAQSVHDLAETRVQRHKASISALQSQINSHFLYNTLETINSMALISRNPDIGTVAVSLSHMLRYTSNYKEWEVALADEIRHAEDYLGIMKVRFGDEVTYGLDVPPDLLQARCSKALLQPLIENCIKHTRETTAEAVSIRVAAEIIETGKLKLSVRDNGAGFTEQALAQLRGEIRGGGAQAYSLTGVGLSNLIYRLHMFYGEEADISFRNDGQAGGAVVEVVLPLRDDNMSAKGEDGTDA
ncbi:sensor histidine kinase [Paenibacillus methanolicus]|uniref:Two-component system sensor histidine kinase YesM n=1 Tax=Paenibacillus methanolicus TaxID=582686 RepID=A0A5S5C1W5_9BACL|nr:histidine kinase [Paenibacillus methanolicus]TYP73159.1 two-component system sensor histidine kinase YesM [Paenibacillus methanolicus]